MDSDRTPCHYVNVNEKSSWINLELNLRRGKCGVRRENKDLWAQSTKTISRYCLLSTTCTSFSYHFHSKLQFYDGGGDGGSEKNSYVVDEYNNRVSIVLDNEYGWYCLFSPHCSIKSSVVAECSATIGDMGEKCRTDGKTLGVNKQTNDRVNNIC